MKFTLFTRHALWSAALVFAGFTSLPSSAFAVPPAASRTPAADLNSLAIRERAGLLPGANPLSNGWGVTPAGTHTRISDMALKMAILPDKKGSSPSAAASAIPA